MAFIKYVLIFLISIFMLQSTINAQRGPFQNGRSPRIFNGTNPFPFPTNGNNPFPLTNNGTNPFLAPNNTSSPFPPRRRGGGRRGGPTTQN
ncbi:hypothetical protein KC19_11G152000 [Ceratodon purpureus]|uniref:Uncharacterized protein n=1 Tax=Ceratodon purpureus TaxID=3225 RepID=A0A8T0GE81_CERPU|nr:hypothetical protein KC19_11G152000 [Ceratodon purpureus]